MRRRSSTAGMPMMSSPPMVIRPPVGSMSRLIIFIVVVLPQPDGPTRTQISPAGTVEGEVAHGRRIGPRVGLADVLEVDDRAAGRGMGPLIGR